MKLDIDVGFDSRAEYMEISHYAFRYARRKLVNEDIWNEEICKERAHDMVTDSIISYLKQVAKGAVILDKKSYIMTSINNLLKAPAFIKEKERQKQMIIVSNSDDENIVKYSYNKWVNDNENIPQENPENYLKYYFNIKKEQNKNLSNIEMAVINLKDKGLKNREVSKELNISEGYVSKLVNKILKKITRNDWV